MSHKELRYEIAGIPVLLQSENGELFDDDGILSGFRSGQAEPERIYSFQLRDTLDPVDGELCASAPEFCVVRNGGEIVTFYGGSRPDASGVYAMTRRSQKESIICYRRTEHIRQISPKQTLRCMELPHLLADHEGVLLHCAWIRWNGRGILFTAPSGTGKSTQAQLWCDLMGAELINGDRAAIRIHNGHAFAFGVPMSGSSDVRRNETMPIEAIVYLSQAKDCRIERLRGAWAFRRLWEGCTVPTWDRGDVERITDIVGRIISQVPVFHLACTPDRRAVELLLDTMEV